MTTGALAVRMMSTSCEQILGLVTHESFLTTSFSSSVIVKLAKNSYLLPKPTSIERKGNQYLKERF